MREIKFRAWDLKKKKMSCTFSLEDASYEGFPRPFTDENGECDLKAKYEVMQYTGLKDKDGIEVYEADQIIHPDYPTPLVVIWDYDQWGLFDGICNEASLNSDCEVIGNIYENKRS